MVENFLTVVIGDGFRRLDDRFGPLQAEPVVIVGGTLKSVPNGTGANDNGFDAGSKLGQVRGRNMELEFDCILPSLKPLARLEGKAGCHLEAYKLRIFLSISAIWGADICLTLM